MARELKRLMAYVCMPLIFTVIGYGVLWIAGAPIIDLVYNVGSMVLVQDVPDFNNDLDSVFKNPTIAANVQPETINVSDVEWPKFGQQYAVLTCSRIGVDAPVYFGDSNTILRAGAGQYIGSFLPGYGKTILLCAHNTTFFKPLQNVEVGDVFEYKTNYGIYQYQVTSTAIKNYADTSAYDLLQEKEELILYTCYPFETMAGTKTDRLFVYCDKITGPSVVNN